MIGVGLSPSIWNELYGCEVKYYQNKFRTRSIEYTEKGEKTLILLHGIGGHAEAYSRNIKRLGQNFKTYAIDFLGHGLSQKEPLSPERIPLLGKQVIDFMDVLKVEKAHIAGESLGGWVALWITLNHPDRVDKIVLNTTAGVRHVIQEDAPNEGRELLARRSIDALHNLSRETVRKRLEWLMASPDRVTEELIDLRYQIYADPVTKVALTKFFENSFGLGTSDKYEFTKEDIAKVSVPTLVLWTEKNPGVGPESGRRLAEIIPGAEFYCINDAGHWPQWEKAEEHDRVITEFLSNKRKA